MNQNAILLGFAADHLATFGFGPAGAGSLVPSMTLRQAVFLRLAGSSDVRALVGTRIYFGVLPQSAALQRGAALTFSVISRDYGHHLKGSDGTSSARVQISAHSVTEAASDSVAIAVRALWDGYAGTIGTVEVTASIQQGEVDLPHPPRAGTDQWIYEIATDFKVNHRVSIPLAIPPVGPAPIGEAREVWTGAWSGLWTGF